MDNTNKHLVIFKSVFILTVLLVVMVFDLQAQNNLALTGTTLTNNNQDSATSKNVIDGNKETAWNSTASEKGMWLTVVLPGATEITQVKILMQTENDKPIQQFAIQTFLNGNWGNQIKISDNQQKEVTVTFKKSVLTDRLRLAVSTKALIHINEFEIYGQQYISEDATPVRKIITNQSGYNLDKPKRFTAPEIADDTEFYIKNLRTQEKEFQGIVNKHIGDFSKFNPLSADEYTIAIDTFTSYPFRIGPFWLERVTYQNMVDFMAGARHYTGSTKEIRGLSWAWRDGDFFNWAMQSLVAQCLSNPEAYKRQEKKITYASNASFSPAYRGKWGKLEPYNEDAPDIVKLIHWDADIKISQELEHEHQKAELAHFLYAYPYLKEWLPKQNFDVVYAYLKDKWTKDDVRKESTTFYDKSPAHNLLSLKTKLGTTKGELPPGHSVIPNLMMYEVAKKKGEQDADKYFEAAYNQQEWMIANLDWNDPLTTKGQRMSEHITMRAFAYFHNQYPNKAPKGLSEKVEAWAKVAIRRSDNMWDFRKYTDHDDWIPNGWNETGNILSFPACALAAASVIKDDALKQRLHELAWSHFDDAFGRNPTGRHFSYDGPSEIESVDLGWYSFHHGGMGLLEEVPFVFDGSPKTNHYPNHPEIGNLGWTEGWVQHNTAFNMSMAYLANDDTEITITKKDKKNLVVRLKTPLNFDENTTDTVQIKVIASSGDIVTVTLKEEGPFSKYLTGSIQYKKGKVKKGNAILQIQKEDTVSTSYGLGYFQKNSSIEMSKKQ